MVDDLGRHLGGEDLDHGRLHAHVAAVVLLDGGVHHHEAAGMELHGRVGHPPLDGLAVGELLAEGDALVGMLDQHIEGALGHAGAPGAHLQATHGEAELHRREAGADLAQHLALGHAAILEHDLVGALSGQHRNRARHDQALGALVDQEGGDAAPGAERGVGHRHGDGEVGLGDAADPDLAAVDHPVVAVLHRPGLHAGRIAAGARLGNGDGRAGEARGIGFEVLLALLGIGRGQQHVQVGRVRREGERHAGVADLLVDADEGDGGQVGAAHLLRHVERPQAEILALLEEPGVLLVVERRRLPRGEAFEDVLLKRHQFVADELLHQLPQHPMLFTDLMHLPVPPGSTAQFDSYVGLPMPLFTNSSV